MQNEKWLEMLPLNRIQYTIVMADGSTRRGLLRFTKYQQMRHAETQNKQGADMIDIAEIVLNPTADKVEFTKSEIEEALDLDEIKLLCNIWLEKKVIAPSLRPNIDKNFF